MLTFQTLNGVHIVYHEAKRQTALVDLVNGTAFNVQVSFHLIEDFFFFHYYKRDVRICMEKNDLLKT